MRRGELLGLTMARPQRVACFRIRQTVVLVKGKGKLDHRLPLRRQKGARAASALSPDVLDRCCRRSPGQLQDSRTPTRLGDAWTEHGLVFVSETGTPLNPDNLTRLRKQLMKDAKVPTMRLHDLRHLHASMAIRSGVDPKVLADRLGHSRASFTLDVYTHLFDEQRVNAAVSLLDFLPKSDPAAAN